MKKGKLTITLQERTEDHVRVYFENASDPEIKKWLPQKAKTVAEAVADFQKSLPPMQPATAKRSTQMTDM